jgi:hypothetical protein
MFYLQAAEPLLEAAKTIWKWKPTKVRPAPKLTSDGAHDYSIGQDAFSHSELDYSNIEGLLAKVFNVVMRNELLNKQCSYRPRTLVILSTASQSPSCANGYVYA